MLIGKIVKFENGVGNILANGVNYLFTYNDIIDGENFSINDEVVFRGEEVQGIWRAFFVKKIDQKINSGTKVFYKKDF